MTLDAHRTRARALVLHLERLGGLLCGAEGLHPGGHGAGIVRVHPVVGLEHAVGAGQQSVEGVTAARAGGGHVVDAPIIRTILALERDLPAGHTGLTLMIVPLAVRVLVVPLPAADIRAVRELVELVGALDRLAPGLAERDLQPVIVRVPDHVGDDRAVDEVETVRVRITARQIERVVGRVARIVGGRGVELDRERRAARIPVEAQLERLGVLLLFLLFVLAVVDGDVADPFAVGRHEPAVPREHRTGIVARLVVVVEVVARAALDRDRGDVDTVGLRVLPTERGRLIVFVEFRDLTLDVVAEPDRLRVRRLYLG